MSHPVQPQKPMGVAIESIKGTIPIQTISQEKPPLGRYGTDGTDHTHVDIATVKDNDSDFPDGGLRAWLVVLGAVCLTITTFGVVNSWGVFQAYYSVSFLPDASPSALSWIGSVQYALTFFPGIFTGRLFDLGYFRIPMLCFSISLLAATFLIAECTLYWHFLLCQGFAVGAASGCLFGPALGCVAHWFKRRRSTAYGIVACGTSIGGTVFPILVWNLIPMVGFRWTMRIFGFVVLVFVGIGNLALRRRIPAVKVSGGLFNFRVLRYAPFSFYVAAGFFCFLGRRIHWYPYSALPNDTLANTYIHSFGTVLTYINSSAVSYGISENLAFYMVSIANASSGLGRIWAGVVADRIGPLNNMIPMTAIAAFLTFAWPYARTSQSLIVIAVIYGISSGAFVGLLAIPVAKMGNIDDVGRRQGMLFSLLTIGAILGPPISGLINRATRGYTAVGFYAGSVMLVGVVLMTISRGLLAGRFFGGKA